MAQWEPSYLAVYRSGELWRRVEYARNLLAKPCRVCPRECPVDRLSDQFGLCRVGRYAYVASYFPHFGEEDCLRGWNGSGTIFFSGCNLRCVFCLTPEMRVWTDQGPRSLADLFEEGDHELAANCGRVRLLAGVTVCTRPGHFARATKAFCHGYRGELVVLKPYGLPALRLTPNHPVFVADQPGGLIRKVPAAEVAAGQWLFVPVPVPASCLAELDVRAVLAGQGGTVSTRPRQVLVSELEPLAEAVTHRELTTARVAAELGYRPAYIRDLLPRVRRDELRDDPRLANELVTEGGRVRFRTEKGLGVPARVPINEDLARLLGFYCSKGYVTSAKSRPNSHILVFSFGKSEADLAEEVAGLIRRVFGVEPRRVLRRTTRTVEVSNASLALLFKGLAGAKAREKRVPPPLFQVPTPVVRAFLEAYWAGDGTRHGRYLAANTVSLELALGLTALLLRLGVFPYFYVTSRPAHRSIEGQVVNQHQTLYYVRCRRAGSGQEAGLALRPYRRVDGGFWVRVRRVEREPYEGPVYNLEVDDPDHSYTVHGVAVGNCQNFDISWQLQGERVTPVRLARMMLELQAWGCHNINWVTPEHVVPQILEALPLAIEGGLRLPIVYNTSAYDSLDSLRLMDGIVDIYMPDFKFWNPERARKYSKTPDYPEVARRTIKEMHRQVGNLVLDEFGLARRGLLLRHLVMPGMLDETEAILRWVAEELGPDTYINVMAQYYPAGRVPEHYPEINRHLYREEFERALEIADRLGLRRLDVRSRAQVRRLKPAPVKT